MLWIVLGIGFIVFIFGIVLDEECPQVIGGFIFVLLLVMILINISNYNNTKVGGLKKIEVLEQNNIEVMESIEPLVQKYLNYESENLEKFKVNSNNIIALSLYPELKGNEFISKQIDLVVKNNEEIKKVKLDLAGLNCYKLWLVMGE